MKRKRDKYWKNGKEEIKKRDRERGKGREREKEI